MTTNAIRLFDAPPPAARWARRLIAFLLGVSCGVVILAVLCFCSACGLVQQEQPVNDKATGKPLYVHEVTGKATTEPTDAAGNPRARATVPVSTGNVEQAVEIGKGLASNLPPPAGLIAELVGSGLLAATAVALRNARRKRLEELGLNEELIELAANDEEIARKMEAKASSEIKRRIADRKAGKRKPATA